MKHLRLYSFGLLYFAR